MLIQKYVSVMDSMGKRIATRIAVETMSDGQAVREWKMTTGSHAADSECLSALAEVGFNAVLKPDASRGYVQIGLSWERKA
jgi:hypothetical protein